MSTKMSVWPRRPSLLGWHGARHPQQEGKFPVNMEPSCWEGRHNVSVWVQWLAVTCTESWEGCLGHACWERQGEDLKMETLFGQPGVEGTASHSPGVVDCLEPTFLFLGQWLQQGKCPHVGQNSCVASPHTCMVPFHSMATLESLSPIHLLSVLSWMYPMPMSLLPSFLPLLWAFVPVFLITWVFTRKS